SEAARGAVERSAGHPADAPDLHLPDQRRYDRRRGEQRALLPGAAQGQGAGGDAHLRERTARRRALARRSGAQPVADAAHELASRARAVDEALTLDGTPSSTPGAAAGA